MQASSSQPRKFCQSISFALLNLFIVCYSVGAFIMCCPPSVCRDTMVAAVKPVFNYFGLYQYFWMYAPDPPKIYTIRIYADITYADGKQKTWELPRLQTYKNDFYLHQSKHRYYQWKYYLFDPKTNFRILPDTALFAARMNDDPQNPPIRVDLYKDTEVTLYPVADDGEIRTDHLPRDMFFTYHIKPGEL